MPSDRSLLRRRREDQHHKVEFVELFFDLVFVFAVTQISHALIAHFSVIDVLRSVLLALAVWWVWVYTAWVTNWLDPAKLPVRLAILALMLPGLILSSSIPKAFDTRGLAFAGAYVTMQVGRTLFFLWAVQGHPVLVSNFQRILAWLSLGGVFWIAGAFAEGTTRLGLWAIGFGLEALSPALGFWTPGLGRSNTAEWDVEGGHMAERCALFVIIALGESLLVTGATFAGLDWNAATITALVASFVGSLAMWWLYFDTSAEVGSHAISHAADPGRIARLAYTYIHLLLVAGIILSAVADEFVLAHPLGHTSVPTIVVTLGGTALFLIGNALFRWSIVGRFPISAWLGLAATAVLVPLAAHLPPVGLMAAAALVLAASAAYETRASARSSTPAHASHA